MIPLPADDIPAPHDRGRCRACGHKLTDPISRAVGIGPDCRKALGITRSPRLRIRTPRAGGPAPEETLLDLLEDTPMTTEPEHITAIRDVEVERLRADLETARTQLREYESAICWETTCTGCANLLSQCVAADARAAQAEAALEQIRTLHRVHSCADYQHRIGVPIPCTNDGYCSCGQFGDRCPELAILDTLKETR